jgi:hypothetical protein
MKDPHNQAHAEQRVAPIQCSDAARLVNSHLNSLVDELMPLSRRQHPHLGFQKGVVPLTTGTLTGLVPGPVPGIKVDGGGPESSAKAPSGCVHTEYVISPFGEIQAQVFASVSRAIFFVLATVKLASPSKSLTFVAHSFSSRALGLIATSTLVPRTPSDPCGVLTL